ncbi:leucine-rich repeat-containing protein 15-like [Culicoides brevitarsis]|uniref:leucine-rich repeat-containing protein 15-like n=1 Tax=Culicoides brevitarsis TaxID=469753 RepID=UPI00307BA9B3
MNRFIAILILFLVGTTKVQCQELEVECQERKNDSDNCYLRHVHLENNSTKLRFIIPIDSNFTNVVFDCSKINIFPTELFDQLPNVDTLELNDAQISVIPDFSFQNATKLHQIHLQSNLLRKINENTFVGATYLEFIDLSKNRIDQISPKAFDSTPNVKIIVLSENKLESIDAATFAPLKNLTELSLYENQIKLVAASAFSNNGNLEEILLHDNNLESLELEISSKMKILDVSRNKLKSLTLKPGNVTANEAKIKILRAIGNKLLTVNISTSLDVRKLFVSQNQIGSLENVSTSSNLSEFRIANNLLQNLHGIEIFSDVEIFDLSGNRNITFEKNIFGSLKQLFWLKLTDVSMNSFDLNWFAKHEELAALEIDENNLKELDYEGITQSFPALSRVHINFNQFNCTFLEKMLNYWRNNTLIHVYDVNYFIESNVYGVLCVKEEKEFSELN